MSPLYLEHVSDFFLLLEKAEVLSEASKALATHHACLLPFSFPFSVFWLPDHLLHSLIPGLLHIVGLVIWNLYSFFIPQCDGHFWGRPSLNPPPAAPDLVRLFHTTVYLSLEAFLQLWLYSYSCDWLADVGLPTGCMFQEIRGHVCLAMLLNSQSLVQDLAPSHNRWVFVEWMNEFGLRTADLRTLFSQYLYTMGSFHVFEWKMLHEC